MEQVFPALLFPRGSACLYNRRSCSALMWQKSLKWSALSVCVHFPLAEVQNWETHCCHTSKAEFFIQVLSTNEANIFIFNCFQTQAGKRGFLIDPFLSLTILTLPRNFGGCGCGVVLHCFVLFWDRALLYSPGWPRTLDSLPQVLGLQAWPTNLAFSWTFCSN